MNLSQLIRDVTQECVSAQTFRYEPRNWTAYPQLHECLVAVGYTQTELELGFPLSRQCLSNAFSKAIRDAAISSNRESLAATVALVPIWGYPRGVVGPGNRHPIHSVLDNRGEIWKKIAAFKAAPASTAQTVAAMTFSNVGLSTLSKLLYFAGLVSHEGPLLIYDQMVMRALNHHRFAEYGDWPEYSSVAQRTTYADFISRTARAAARLGCAPDIIEFALFKEGQRLGKKFGKPTLMEAADDGGAPVAVGPVTDGTVDELVTFTGRSRFVAHLHSNNDVTLYYGTVGVTRVPAETFKALATYFSGCTVPLTAKAGPSLQAWLTAHFSKVRLASYIGPLLVRLGYGVREGNMVQFQIYP